MLWAIAVLQNVRTVKKGMVENIKKVSERATMTEIQKICMLGSARILRKVLSVWTEWLTWVNDTLGAWFVPGWCTKRTPAKSVIKEIIIIIMIIEAGRPDIVVVNKQDGKCDIIDITVSILVNSGYRNIYLAAFCRYSPWFLRIIVKYSTNKIKILVPYPCIKQYQIQGAKKVILQLASQASWSYNQLQKCWNTLTEKQPVFLQIAASHRSVR